MSYIIPRLTVDSEKVLQPVDIELQLKPHQLAALYRMKQLDLNCNLKVGDYEVDSNLGFLGDIPGSGKTITMISLIAITKEIERKVMPGVTMFSRMGYGIINKKDEAIHESSYKNTTLIVVPANIVDHWEKHLEYSNLEWETVTEKNMEQIVPEGLDVILCSSKIYNRYVDYTYHKEIENGICECHECEYTSEERVKWDRVIYDETFSIHLPGARFINSRFIWFVGSNYRRIPMKRNRGFIKNIFKSNWENPIDQFFSKVIIESDPDFVRKSFALENPRNVVVNCEMSQAMSVLRDYVSEAVLTYLDAGDMDAAVLELGGSVETDNTLIDLITKDFKNKITTINAELVTINSLELSELEKTKKSKKLQDKLNSIVSRRNSLITDIQKISDKSCLICTEPLEAPTMVGCCKNMFCAACIIEWMKVTPPKCPICREPIDSKNLVTVSDTRKERVPLKTKTEAVLEILKKPGRFIIFSDHSFDHMKAILQNNSIKHEVMAYSSPMKTVSVLKKFRERAIDVILLNSRHNGAGLEIPEATDVILMHRLPPDLEMQTVGRAYRPGRICPLTVWKLAHLGEYEI
jgi:hypothetical protein